MLNKTLRESEISLYNTRNLPNNNRKLEIGKGNRFFNLQLQQLEHT